MLCLPLLLQVIRALTAASTADLLAVSLNVATAVHLNNAGCCHTATIIHCLLKYIRKEAPAAGLHEAAAAEALLRLFIQLCRRPHLAGEAATPLRSFLAFILYELCIMPGAQQLPAGTWVELVELVLQTPMTEVTSGSSPNAAVTLLQLLRLTTPGRSRLARVHVKRLLALLQGPTAAAAAAATTACQQHIIWGCAPSIRSWLAWQREQWQAAAELGLTAADLPHPAAALLCGDQHDEEDA
jgi:hypothetical protein